MSDNEYDCLKLENQLCFPLYVCSKEIVRRYTPFLEPLGLTYTQYIALMALWEYGSMSVKDLGSKLHLDSGTLTPLLKKLEDKGYVRRVRSKNDERLVIIELTDEGIALRDEAKKVPESMGSCINMTYDEFVTMKTLLDKIIGSFEE